MKDWIKYGQNLSQRTRRIPKGKIIKTMTKVGPSDQKLQRLAKNSFSTIFIYVPEI